MNKDFYNQSSASNLGWDPTWFGEKYFDDKLVRAVKRFQKRYGLKADGLCGPSTFRRLWVERQENITITNLKIHTIQTTLFTMASLPQLSGTN